MHNSFGVGWRQVGACLVLLAICGVITSTYTVVAIPLGAEFRPSRTFLMLAMTVMSLVSAVFSPFLGRALDRGSLRHLMMIGAGCVVAGFLALSFVTSFNQVIVVYGFLMAPANLLIGPIAATVLLSRWFVARRGVAIGIAISGVAFGGFVFPPVVQMLIDSYAWREAFRLLALILAVLAVPALMLVVNSPADRDLQPDGMLAEPVDRRPAATGTGRSTSAILTDPAFWAVAVIFSVVLSAMKGVITNLMPLAMDRGIRGQDAAMVVSLFAGCGFVAKLGFAAISDRIGLRVLVFSGLAGFAVGMACLLDGGSGFAQLAAGVGLVGLCGGFMVPLQGLLISRLFAADVGRVMGLIGMVTLCAMLATPLIFGMIFDRTGSYAAAFAAFLVLAIGCLTLVPLIRAGRAAMIEDPIAARMTGGTSAPLTAGRPRA